MKRKSGKIAFCGIMGAVILILMLTGNIIPIATYAVPCLGAVLMMIVVIECGMGSAWLLYIATSLLSFFIVADKELLLFYVLLLGFYPMIKPYLGKIRPKALSLLLKLVIFNLALGEIYLILLLIFPVADIIREFAEMGRAFTAVLIVLGNITFILLDLAMDRINILYIKKLRPRIIKGARSQ